MKSLIIGVMRGGPSSESPVSLKSGESVSLNLANMPRKYSVRDILIDKKGDWYFDGKPSHPEKVFRSVDVVFNALHGYYGEDGKVQQLLEHFGVPYTGSGAVASALGMNKILSRKAFEKAGLKIPNAVVVRKGELTRDSAIKIFKSIGPSLAVKPAAGGSSLGIKIIHNFNDLMPAVEAAANLETGFPSALGNPVSKLGNVIVEEFIKGREATCGIIDNFRNEEYYAFPVVEIIPSENSDFFDYGAKYSGESLEICPANFDIALKRKIEMMAREAHQILGCRHYSRADFIVSPRSSRRAGQVYILEVNTLPGLTAESLLPKSVEAIGLTYPQFLDHLITLAMEKK